MTEGLVRRACAALANWAARRRATVLGLLAAVTFVSVALMSRLTVSGSLADTIGDASPAAGALSTIAARFDVGEELLVLVSASPDTSPGAARTSLSAFAHSFEHTLLADPASAALAREVTWRRDQAITAWLDEVALPGATLLFDDVAFDELAARLTTEGIRARVRRAETLIAAPGPLAQGASTAALDDLFDVRALLVDQFRRTTGAMNASSSDTLALSDDQRSLLIRVAPLAPPDDLAAARDLVDLARRAIDRTPHAGLDIALTGAPAIAAHSASSIRADLIMSVIGALIGVQVLFLLAYRGPLAFLVITLPAGLGIVWAFGAESLIGGSLTPLGAAIGAILVGLGVDYAVHAASAADADATGAEAVARIGPGVVAAALTTIIAFGALATSSLEILHAFAALGAMGLAGALLATILLMPILLGRGVKGRRISPPTLPVAASNPLLILSTLITVACVATIAVRGFSSADLLPLDDDLDAMHPSPNPALDAQRRVDAAFSSRSSGLPILIEAADDHQLLRRAHDLGAALRSNDAESAGITGAFGIHTIIPLPASIDTRRARLASLDITAISRDLRAATDESVLAPQAFDPTIEQLQLMLTASNPPTLPDLRAHPDLARTFLPAEGPPAALTYVLLDTPLDDRSTRAARINAINRIIEFIPGATLTGLPVLGHEAERLALAEAPRLLAAAAIGVLLWLALFFRRPVNVLLALLPGAFAFLVLLALAAPLGIKLNIVNMAALPLLVGIGVDDGIFMVAAASQGLSRSALRARLTEVSHAVVVTSLTTILAFGSLVTASTPAIRSLGLLVGIGVLACLWGSLFLLAPILLLRASPDAAERPA